MDSANEHLIERSKYYVSDKSGWFYEAPCRFNNHCNNRLIILLSTYMQQSFDLFVPIYIIVSDAI